MCAEKAVRSGFGTTSRPKSLALPASSRGTVRALYAYLSSGEHQINFLEGDLILLLGDDPVSFHANANGTMLSHVKDQSLLVKVCNYFFDWPFGTADDDHLRVCVRVLNFVFLLSPRRSQ